MSDFVKANVLTWNGSEWVETLPQIPDSVIWQTSYDEGSGTTANDNIAVADGEISAVWHADSDAVGGHYLHFDGEAHHVSYGTPDVLDLDPNGEWTIELAAYESGVEGGSIFTKMPADASQAQYQIVSSTNGLIGFNVGGVSEFEVAELPTTMTPIHLRNDGGTVTAFLDGSEVVSFEAGDATNTENVYAGARTDGDSFLFEGGIDSPIIYDQPLSDDQIADRASRYPNWATNPGDPAGETPLLARHRDPPSPSPFYRNMDTTGEVLYWTLQHSVTTWDISSPEDPIQLDSEALPNEGGCGLRVTDDGNYTFVTDTHASYEDAEHDLRAFDTSDPADITQVDVLTDSRFERAHGISLGPNEDYLFVTGWFGYNEDGEFVVVDVTDPTDLTVTDSVSIESPHDVAVDGAGDYAFVDGHGDYVYSIDVSDPSNISLLDTLDYTSESDSSAGGMRLSSDGNYAFTGSGARPDDGMLLSIDITDPSNMTEASRATVQAQGPYRLRVHDGRVYSASTYGGVDVWDVSDPEAISHIVGRREDGNSEVEVYGEHLFAAEIDMDEDGDRSHELQVFGIDQS